MKKLKDGYVVDVPRNTDELTIEFEINVDGIPLYNSSSLEFWPILIRSKNLKDHRPFSVAIFCGEGKPDTIEMFLKIFLDECLLCLENGIDVLGKNYSIQIKFFTCDAPARAYLKQTKGHSSTVM